MLALLHGPRADHRQVLWYWSRQHFPDYSWTLASAVSPVFFLPCCHVPANNSTMAQYTTPNTLHHLTPDIHYLLLYLSLSLSWCRLSSSDRIGTILTTYTGINPFLCPSSPDRRGTWHPPNGGQVPVRLKHVYLSGPLRVQPIRIT